MLGALFGRKRDRNRSRWFGGTDQYVEHRFDLAICMEVAEHLDPIRADSLVNDLCDAAGRLRAAASETGRMPLCVVHPGLFRVHSQPSAPPDPEPGEHHAAPSRF
jgi:hypothetical protein